jgi:hypothetical protein
MPLNNWKKDFAGTTVLSGDDIHFAVNPQPGDYPRLVTLSLWSDQTVRTAV